MVWIEFIASAGLIVFASMQLVKYGDVIALRTKFGGMMVGTLLLAAATSLPEVLTTVTACLQGEPNLAAGNLFGSNAINIVVLAVLDIMHSHRRLTRRNAERHALTGSLAILMITLAIFFLVARLPFAINFGKFKVGVDSIMMVVVYFFALSLIIKQSKKLSISYSNDDLPEGTPELKPAIIWFAGAVAILFIVTPWMVSASTRIAEITGLGTTFIGATLVAFVTSLPELVSTISAAKIGADDMAIGNLFGSNMFNMMSIGIADFFLAGSLFFHAVDPSFILAGMIGLLMTVLAVVGTLGRLERKIWFIELDALLLILLYIAGTYLLYVRGIQ
jgi:cation:H+ antiporter